MRHAVTGSEVRGLLIYLLGFAQTEKDIFFFFIMGFLLLFKAAAF